MQSGGDYDIQSSYLICIADFNSEYIPHFRSDNHYTCLQDGKQYFFGGTIILIQLRKLNKKSGELQKIDEIWAYLLTNLANMDAIPDKLKEYKEFKKLKKAEKRGLAEGWQKDEIQRIIFQSIAPPFTK